MVNSCIDRDEPFGVVLLRSGMKESPSAIHRVGVMARTVRVERIAEGRMNILAEGESRFRINRFTQRVPFWSGDIASLEETDESTAAIGARHDEICRLYRRAYRLDMLIAGEKPGDLELPESSVELSFLVSYAIDIDCEEKQKLLETVSTRDRLDVLADHLRVNNERLEKHLARKKLSEKSRGNGDLGPP